MIFYFSGTGNSLHAAKGLQKEGEALYNMTDCLKNRQFGFHVPEGEKLCFVFPVYYGGLPSIVKLFLKHASLTGDLSYVCGVITAGGGMYGSGKMLERCLKAKGCDLKAVAELVMPDNYILLYEPESEEEQIEKLESSEIALAKIKDDFDNREELGVPCTLKGELLTQFMYPLYVRGRKTEKFYTDDQCIGCGVCASRCPVEAIKMVEGKPTWVKDRCVQCLACMRCGAIQYGKRTVGRPRYTHPDLRKKKAADCH